MQIQRVSTREIGSHRDRLSPATVRHPADFVGGALHLAAMDGVDVLGTLSCKPDNDAGDDADHWTLYAALERPDSGAMAALLAAAVAELDVWWGADVRCPADLAPAELLLAAGMKPDGDHYRRRFPRRDPPQGPAGSYSANSIRVLHSLTAVRKRPAMYFGSVGREGLRAMALELISNAIDLHLSELADSIDFQIDGDTWIVRDDGPGLPVLEDPDHGALLTRLLTTLHAGPSRHQGRWHVHAGVGVGLAPVNALSAELEVTVDRPEGRFVQRFDRGQPVSFLERRGAARGRGTTLRLRPDPQIFGETRLRPEDLAERLQELAWLNPGLRFRLQGRALPGEAGLAGLVRALCGDAAPLARLQVSGERQGIAAAIAVDWVNPALPPKAVTFGNQIRLDDGVSAPLEGLIAGLAGTREAGRVAAVSVLLEQPRYAGPTRQKLVNPEAAEVVEALLSEALPAFLEAHPELAL